MTALDEELFGTTKPLYRLVCGRVRNTEVVFSKERVCFPLMIIRLVHMRSATERKDPAVFLILGLVLEVLLYRIAVPVEVELWEIRICHP